MGLAGLIAVELKIMTALPTFARDMLAHVRKALPRENAVAILHLGAESGWLVSSDDAEHERLFELNLGTDKTARSHFKGSIPTPLEVENIIAVIEDEIMPIGRQVPVGSHLFTSDPDLVELALVAGAAQAPTMRLTLDALEQLFNRWVAFIEGRPGTQDSLPRTHRFAVCLLILREVMHHWQIENITVVKEPCDVS